MMPPKTLGSGMPFTKTLRALLACPGQYSDCLVWDQEGKSFIGEIPILLRATTSAETVSLQSPLQATASYTASCQSRSVCLALPISVRSSYLLTP